MKREKKKSLSTLLWITAIFLLFTACSHSEIQSEEEQMAYEAGTLSFGVGEENSFVYYAGTATAGAINNTVPGIHAAIETTKGAMINAVNVSNGTLDLALIEGNVAYDAVNGLHSFQDEPLENLRVLGACYQEVSEWMALESSGLTQVHELKGKIISSGPKASQTELSLKHVFEVMEIDSANTEIYSDSLRNSAEHIKRETADAVHVFSAVPYPVHETLANEYDTILLSYTEEELDTLIKSEEWYFKTEIPAGTYRGQEHAIPTFGVKVLLCASTDMDEDLAYEIARALDLNGPVYTNGHKFMQPMQDKDFLCNELPIPLHDGAKKYYKEAGFLTE